MSDNILRVLPASPTHRPSEAAADAAYKVAQQLAPDAEAVMTVASPWVDFVDAGQNFESVSCPRCGSVLDMGWWAERMDKLGARRFRKLGVRTPCCDFDTSLDDLVYFWPCAFASWWIEVLNPGRGVLQQEEVESLEEALDFDVRIIWTHV